MRLLQRHGDIGFRLVKFEKHIPPYAILSHTWGTEDDEVNFSDINDGRGTTKPGYRKIEFCAEQAARDDLEFFWVDTCCIDKSSSAELAEAINSMFRWYRESARCYAFLQDVSTHGPQAIEQELAFQKSRWFTRGWTLQELLAPKHVDFFSAEGHHLGDKSTRAQEITRATGIPIEALREKPLSDFSVDQRMMWAKGRETTRDEDMAYCLMGLFEVFMGLLYGEGQERALLRLQKEIRSYQKAHPRYRQGESSDTIQRNYFRWALQIPTMLQETNDQFRLLMADSRTSGEPDLIAVKKKGTTRQNIEINVLYGAHGYQNIMLRILTPDFTPLDDRWDDQLDFVVTDWNGDGTLDLVAIKKFQTESHKTEVHVFSGASKFQRTLLQVGTALEETDETWSFGMARGLGGERPDLYAIKKSNTKTKTTEVHVLRGDTNYQQFIFKTDTSLPETGPESSLIITDWNGDGLPDLVAIKKAESKDKYAELQVLSGASTYKECILRAETLYAGGNPFVEFAVADWTRNGKPDLIAFKKSITGSNMTEMHVMTQHD